MYNLKYKPVVLIDGKIKENIEIKNGALTIKRLEGDLKFENDKWYFFGFDNVWHYLGLGAHPSYETDIQGVINQELFNNVFEEEV